MGTGFWLFAHILVVSSVFCFPPWQLTIPHVDLVQVPVAVAWIQGRVLWRAEITCYDGSKMDGWQYSLSAERALHANPELVPDREPDVDASNCYYLLFKYPFKILFVGN